MNITIIGAGPRGLATLDRLVSKGIENKNLNLNIRLYDPYSIGGRVWDPFIPYNKFMLMNTITSQISLFVDKSIQNVGLINNGLNMYEWLSNGTANDFINSRPELDIYKKQLKLGPNDYSYRGLMGVYSLWFFQEIIKKHSENTSILYIQDYVNDIAKNKEKFIISTKNPENSWESDEVIMALGHSKNKLNNEEKKFNNFAKKNNLTYIKPGWPSEAKLDRIKAQEPVIIRGLGLSFFDYMAALTIGRGGEFIKNNKNELVYKKSKNEPIIYVGSRGGMPIHARGVNVKGPSELYHPKFFTKDNLEKIIDKDRKISYSDFFQLFNKEIQYKHYTNFSKNKLFAKDLETSDVSNFKDIATKFNIPADQIWDWEKLLYSSSLVSRKKNLNKWFISYLSKDIEDAYLNNVQAPFAGAFDILRDIRDTVRFIVEHDYFRPEEFKKFLHEFTPINVLLSVGPPVERIEQMRALIKAGILNVLGPGIFVKTDNQNKIFIASSLRDEKILSKQLIEARLFSNDINNVSSNLQKNLLNKGLIKSTILKKDKESIELSAIEIDRNTFNLINSKNKPIKGIYSFGIPHEGLKWFETVIPRPGVNTVTLREAVEIVNQIIK
ncbi:MAG: FAD/NAD(P)-binding protein [Lactobacillaceae bacterium]|jgi:hypothetical protein|nr:FAD/NAD(P)-binding protein [Lactobacillaceae bacterium]